MAAHTLPTITVGPIPECRTAGRPVPANRFELRCSEISSATTCGLAQKDEDGWRRWAGGEPFGSLLELVDDLMGKHGLPNYQLDISRVPDVLL